MSTNNSHTKATTMTLKHISRNTYSYGSWIIKKFELSTGTYWEGQLGSAMSFQHHGDKIELMNRLRQIGTN
jgi:hypothetical protein